MAEAGAVAILTAGSGIGAGTAELDRIQAKAVMPADVSCRSDVDPVMTGLMRQGVSSIRRSRSHGALPSCSGIPNGSRLAEPNTVNRDCKSDSRREADQWLA